MMSTDGQQTQSWNERAWIWLVRTLFNAPSLLRWALTIIVVAFPPIYLAYNPSHFTPLVDTLFSIFLFILGYWIGYSGALVRATQQANDRWLPQAESVIFRLMTLHANVRRFSHATRSSCANAECELPELKNEEMRAVRIKFKTDCDASGQRLDDIAHQLEDAIEDWRRFITANCYGDECERIFEALQQRETKLAAELLSPNQAVEPIVGES